MATSLQIAAQQLSKAQDPEDVFGVLVGDEATKLTLAKKIYRRLAKIVHEDLYTRPADKAIAREAFKELQRFWGEAQLKIEQGIYGNRTLGATTARSGPLVFRTGRYSYQVLNRIHSGSTCGIFQGIVVDRKNNASRVILRVPHSSVDNDLMEREARAFDRFGRKVKETSKDPESAKTIRGLASRLPDFLESVKLAEPGSTNRRVTNVFLQDPMRTDGWFTLEQIRTAYPGGVSTRVMTFVWNRILEGLTLAHSARVVHGGLTPNHVLIHARDHQGSIIDWTASCRTDERETVPYVEKRYAAYYPPEILSSSGVPSPASDIFMSAWCMTYLLGGDPATQTLPSNVEQPFREFINQCLQPKQSRRPYDGKVAWGEFTQVAKRVFPKREFAQLEMSEVV